MHGILDLNFIFIIQLLRHLCRLELQHLIRQIGQFGAFALFEPHMGIQFVVFYAVDKVGEAVALGVEVRGVNLVDIAGKDDLGAFASAGDDGFYLMRGEVLGFVNNEKDV
jgi:hypothetical protein